MQVLGLRTEPSGLRHFWCAEIWKELSLQFSNLSTAYRSAKSWYPKPYAQAELLLLGSMSALVAFGMRVFVPNSFLLPCLKLP